MSLEDKNIHELRAIAEGYGVGDLFSLPQNKLIREIRKSQDVRAKEIVPEMPKPEYDPRIRNKPPAKVCDQESILRYLEPYISRGLIVGFPEPERWHMRYNKKEDSGTMRMPPRVVIKCAERVMS